MGIQRDGRIETVLRLVVSLSAIHEVVYAALDPHRATAWHNPLGRPITGSAAIVVLFVSLLVIPCYEHIS